MLKVTGEVHTLSLTIILVFVRWQIQVYLYFRESVFSNILENVFFFNLWTKLFFHWGNFRLHSFICPWSFLSLAFYFLFVTVVSSFSSMTLILILVFIFIISKKGLNLLHQLCKLHSKLHCVIISAHLHPVALLT